MNDPFAPIVGPAARLARKPDWQIVRPVPDNAPPPPERHPQLGKASALWRYLDATGRLLGYACRFDKGDDKQFRPLALYRAMPGGALEWRWESWPAPRPLYGLDRLAARPGAPVVLCEGEKAAAAAGRLLPGFVAITSPNGAKSAGKSDWSPLRGRLVTVWPDADAPGRKYAEEAARLCAVAGAASVAILTPPAGVKAGWDAADAEEEKWSRTRLTEFLKSATPISRAKLNGAASPGEDKGDDEDEGGKKKKRHRRPARESLVALAEGCEFWHCPNGKAYVSFSINGHRENSAVQSERFADWLTSRAYKDLGTVPSKAAIDDVLRLFRAQAINDGPQRKPAMRVGASGGRWYIDLCDADRRVVEIDQSRWTIRESCDVDFIRTPSMAPLPAPENDVGIEELRGFLNVESDADFIMTVAWLVAALCPGGQYPILIVQGEQGSGKTTFTRQLRRLVDPNTSLVRSPPKDESDLITSAKTAHVQAFDNLSKVDAVLADCFCRMSTGGGFSTRKKYSDGEEFLADVCNPLIINGIPSLATRPDLGRRALIVRLKTIPDGERLAEEDFWRAWQAVEAGILGALCDALSSALRYLPDVRLTGASSMASFFKLVTAASPGLGWEPGAFADAYGSNRADLEGEAFESDPVATAVAKFIHEDFPQGWAGSATLLLELLSPKASDGVKRSRAWPQSAQALGNSLRRGMPVLRGRGISGAFGKRGGERIITFSVKPK